MAEDAAAKGDLARQTAGGMEMEIEELKARLAKVEQDFRERMDKALLVNEQRLDELSDTKTRLAEAERERDDYRERLAAVCAERDVLLDSTADSASACLSSCCHAPVVESGTYECGACGNPQPVPMADSPPVPCPRKYALAECRAAGRVDAETFKMEVLACAGDTWECPRCGHSEPWWTDSNADYATRATSTVTDAPDAR
jgi:hypothetical protein